MTLLRELQRDAIDSSINIATLLRKARILAARLKNSEFEAWVLRELNGYPTEVKLPRYRILSIQAKAHLVIGYTQLRQARIMSSQMPEVLQHWATTSGVRASISELSSLASDGRNGLAVPWPQELAVQYGGVGYGAGRVRVQCLSAWQEISTSAVVGIIETVRNRLLEFAIQIEAEAPGAGETVLGETPLPQETVTQIFNNYISGGVTHIAGTGSGAVSNNAVSTGSMENSQIQQAVAASTQTLSFPHHSSDRSDLERLVRDLTAHLAELGLDERVQRKVRAQLATLQAQLADDEPDPGIIGQAGKTLRSVTEGAIGSLIASAAQPAIWHWIAQAMTKLFPS